MKKIILLLLITISAQSQQRLKTYNPQYKKLSIEDLKKDFKKEEMFKALNKEENSFSLNGYRYKFQVNSDLTQKSKYLIDPKTKDTLRMKTSFMQAKRSYNKTLFDIYIYEGSDNNQLIIYLESNQIANK